MKKSVEDNLIDFFRQNSAQEFAGGALEKMGFTGTNGKAATGSTITRKLRKLAEQGKLKVTHGAHNHSYYSLNVEVVKPKMKQVVIQLPDNTVRIAYEPC